MADKPKKKRLPEERESDRPSKALKKAVGDAPSDPSRTRKPEEESQGSGSTSDKEGEDHGDGGAGDEGAGKVGTFGQKPDAQPKVTREALAKFLGFSATRTKEQDELLTEFIRMTPSIRLSPEALAAKKTRDGRKEVEHMDDPFDVDSSVDAVVVGAFALLSSILPEGFAHELRIAEPFTSTPTFKGGLEQASLSKYRREFYGYMKHKARFNKLDQAMLCSWMRTGFAEAHAMRGYLPEDAQHTFNPFQVLDLAEEFLLAEAQERQMNAGVKKHFARLLQEVNTHRTFASHYANITPLADGLVRDRMLEEFTRRIGQILAPLQMDPTAKAELHLALVQEATAAASNGLANDIMASLLSGFLPSLEGVNRDVRAEALEKALDEGSLPGFLVRADAVAPKAVALLGVTAKRVEVRYVSDGQTLSSSHVRPLVETKVEQTFRGSGSMTSSSKSDSSSSVVSKPSVHGKGGAAKVKPKRFGKDRDESKSQTKTGNSEPKFDLSKKPVWPAESSKKFSPTRPCSHCSGKHYDSECKSSSYSESPRLSSISSEVDAIGSTLVKSPSLFEEVDVAAGELIPTVTQDEGRLILEDVEDFRTGLQSRAFRAAINISLRRGGKLLYTAVMSASALPITLWFDPGAKVCLVHRRVVEKFDLKPIAVPSIRIRGIGDVIKAKHKVRFSVEVATKRVEIEAYVVDSVILETADVLIGMDVIGSQVGVNIGPEIEPQLRFFVELPHTEESFRTFSAPPSAPPLKVPLAEPLLTKRKGEEGTEARNPASLKRPREISSEGLFDFEVSEGADLEPPQKVFIDERRAVIDASKKSKRKRRDYSRRHATLPTIPEYNLNGEEKSYKKTGMEYWNPENGPYPLDFKHSHTKKPQRIRKKVLEKWIHNYERYKFEKELKDQDTLAGILRKARNDRLENKTFEVASAELLDQWGNDATFEAYSRFATASLSDLLAEPGFFHDLSPDPFEEFDDDPEVDAAPFEVLADPPSPEVLAKPAVWREELKKPDLVYEEYPTDPTTSEFLRAMLAEFQDTLVRNEDNIPMGQARDVAEFDIELVDNAYESLDKLGVKAYGVKGPLRQKMRETTAQMCEQGVTTPKSWVRFAFPAFFAKRPRSDKLRLCINFIPLNKVTVPMKTPMPQVEDLIQEIGRKRIHSVMDLRSGYHQFALSQRAKELCNMCTPDSVLGFNVLGFGLCNAVPFFQAEMQKILKDGIARGTIKVYVDDIIISTDTPEEHLKELRYIFTQLRKHNLKAALPKCHFMLKKAKILGHVVGEGVVAPDPELLQGIRDFPEPRSQKAVRQFLGLVNYIRSHIPNLSDLEEPLNALLRGSEKETFKMTPEAREAFLKLKDEKVHHLFAPDYSRPITLQTDASALGAGAVLAHRGTNGELQPIAFASWSFNSAQRNYSATDRELLAIVLALRKFRAFLFGRKFKVLTDHKALSGNVDVSDPHSRIARWSAELSQYDLDIEYIRGALNEVPDALSRNFLGADQVDFDLADMHVAAAEILAVPDDEEWAKALELDPDFMPIIRWLRDEALPDNDARAAAVTFEAEKFLFDSGSGLLFRIVKTETGSRYRRCVPQLFRARILQLYHDAPFSGGHLGRDKTYEKLKRKFYFPDMFRYVAGYVKTCVSCQRIKDGKEVGKAPIGTLPAKSRFDTLSIDLWQAGSISRNGYKYVLTVVDAFTKWAFAIPIRDKKAATVAYALYERVFSVFGFPNRIHSDQGKEFVNEILSALCALFGIDKTRTTAYHPQGNAFAERIHQFFGKALSAYVRAEQDDWDLYLPAIQLAYNSAKHDSTLFTPSELMFGREIRAPGFLSEEDIPAESLPDFVINLRRRLNHAQLLVLTDLEAARLKKAHSQEHIELSKFEDGQQVMLYIPHVKPGAAVKLTPHWSGPYKVTRRALNDKVYYLANENDEPLDHPVSITRLKPFYSREQMGSLNLEFTSPPGLIRGDVSAQLLQSAAIQSQLRRNGHDPEVINGGYEKLISEDNSEVDPTSGVDDPLPLPDSHRAPDFDESLATVRLLEVPDTPANRSIYHSQYSSVKDGMLIIKRRVAVDGKRITRKPRKLSL